MSRLTAHAPAKLNLGLEIVGRRADGYHEIVTVMQAVSRFDRLTVERASEPDSLTVEVSGATIASEENLVIRAARLLRAESSHPAGAHLTLDKRIPLAAGLGGASSDAAATLLALDRLWATDLPPARLTDVAAHLGSDVPFFLTGGTALASGRGVQIRPLTPLMGVWFVVVVPNLDPPIARKTATLYAALVPADYSDGRRVLALADHLPAALDQVPPNAFTRPLYALRPDIAAIGAAMREAGAPVVALSGAGPAHYAILTDQTAAEALAARLALRFGSRAEIFVCAPHPGPPLLDGDESAAR